jgi:3-oxoadipate enol-lactonase
MVSLQDVQIANYVDGRSDRPWIVLANSLGATHAMWDPQVEFLSAKYRILRYDARGHGLSSTPTAPYDIDGLVGDIIGIMDEHGIETADFLGLSLGGTTVLGLALAHPERVNRLIVCDASAETEAADMERWDRRIKQVSDGGTASLGTELLARWYTEAFRNARPDIMDWSLDMLGQTTATGYAGCAAALKNIHLLEQLPSLKKPALYISGQEDGQTPIKMAFMRDMSPNGKLALIDPGAHFPNVESPADFNFAVAEFLGL